jgi:hypothetical protein
MYGNVPLVGPGWHIIVLSPHTKNSLLRFRPKKVDVRQERTSEWINFRIRWLRATTSTVPSTGQRVPCSGDCKRTVNSRMNGIKDIAKQSIHVRLRK